MIRAIAIDDEPLALKVIDSLCSRTEFISLQKSFTQPSEALKHLRKFPTDLIFVDIHMPSMTGISLVKAIQQNTMVIFTTAFSNYAAESYELNAIDYLLKPISQRRFQQACNKALEYYNHIQKKEAAPEKNIFVRADFSLIKIPVSEILYIEGLADYLKIFVKGRKTIVTRMTMKDMIDKLPSEDFIRIHRSFIVPISRIHAVKNNVVFLAESEIPIGKTYVEEFHKRYAPGD